MMAPHDPDCRPEGRQRQCAANAVNAVERAAAEAQQPNRPGRPDCNRFEGMCGVQEGRMELKIKVKIHHDEEEGGYWATVPALPGCTTEADTLDELKANLKEAIEGVLAAREDLSTDSEPGDVMVL
jgi:predicted RNase H-like HicB family nuclease